MEAEIEQMYKDALAVTELQETLRWSALGAVDNMKEKWESASARISGILPRIASVNMDAAKILMTAWKTARESGKDFRLLAACISSTLIPALKESLSVLYGTIQFSVGRWIFQKTGFGFFSVRDTESGRLLHEPHDPMREAADLARYLYRGEMENFHILGIGLGYLAWQIWELSAHTSDIYVYEDDMIMLQMAYRYGVLSWIDPEHLILVDNKDKEKMLQMFLYGEENGLHNHYVSDWKLRSYHDTEYGVLVDTFDFNERTQRACGMQQLINARMNSKKAMRALAELPQVLKTDSSECVVVSAGPSLNDAIPFLRESVGKRTIIVVNTAIKRLEKEKIPASLAVMLDPLPGLGKHIQGIEEYTEAIPLVTVMEGSGTFISAYRGEVFCIEKDGSDDYCWQFGGTVASLGLDVAYYLGASVIYLVGSDLAFSQGQNYAGDVAHDVMENVTEGISVESVDGGTVQTDLLYQRYRETLEAQIAAHPEVKVYNMSKHGAAIKGTEAFYKK